jgi:hypothetical protein
MLRIQTGRLLSFAALFALLTGCTPAVQTIPMELDANRYEPAVARYPSRVGVYYPSDFYDNNFYHVTSDMHELTFHNNPAGASRQALDLAFTALFEEVVPLDSLQQGIDSEDLAFVIVPNITAMRSRLDTSIIAVGMIYQFDFYADGEHLHSWQFTGLDYANGPAGQTGAVSSGSSTLSAGSSGPSLSANRGSYSEEVRYRTISSEEFDAVARKAVWDAVSVFLSGFDQQGLLTDKLPLMAETVGNDVKQKPTDSVQNALALVGPIYDQLQDPAKQQLEDCLVEEVADNELSLRTMMLQDLRDQLYPWLSRSNYPQGVGDLEQIIQQPAVRERLQEQGIQHLLYWDGETIRGQFEGPFLASAYGFIGYERADKTSVINADLLSVDEGKVIHSFEVTQEGMDLMIGLVYVPLPISADTEEDACEQIMREIEAFVQNGGTQKQVKR